MPAVLERCVRKVKAKGGAVNPWAVCSASTGWVRKKGGGWRKKRKKKRGLLHRGKGLLNK